MEKDPPIAIPRSLLGLTTPLLRGGRLWTVPVLDELAPQDRLVDDLPCSASCPWPPAELARPTSASVITLSVLAKAERIVLF